MKLRKLVKLCVHNRVDPHEVGRSGRFLCPGGVFLPDDTLVIEKVDGEWPESMVEEVFGPIYYYFGSEDAPECRDLAVKILDALSVREAECAAAKPPN